MIASLTALSNGNSRSLGAKHARGCRSRTPKRCKADQQVAQIAASIREFGFTNPVLIDEEDGIIAGHGRVRAAHLLGLDEVPCIVLAHLPPAQRRAYVPRSGCLSHGRLPPDTVLP
jgi:hypothetical protein